MSIEVEQVGQTARLVLSGELTIYSVADIKARLAEVMSSASQIEVDLSGVTEVDTAGLQLMLIAKRNPGNQVVFSKHTAAVLRLIDLASLGHALGDQMVLDATPA